MPRILSQTGISILTASHKIDKQTLKKSTQREITTKLDIVLKKLITDYGITNENIMFIVTNMMSVIGKYKTISGTEKKEIVISLIIKAIDDSVDLNNQVKSSLTMTIQTVVPPAIDIMVDIANGVYKFKYLSKLTTWCKKTKFC
jgi:hypothetical protein